MEVCALANTKEENMADFLYNNIMQRFGAPWFLVSDQGHQFMSNMIRYFMEYYQIRHKKASPYHPLSNGQVEVTNWELENILIKIIALHWKDWTTKLSESIWAYNITWKSTIGFNPYESVYGKKPLLPIEFEIQPLRTTIEVGLDLTKIEKNKVLQLNELDEIRLDAFHKIELIQ